MNLKELAQLLGLSQTTVSRALNGYPEVSEKTRLRVQQAAQHHGYRPNPRALSLATGQARAIGHLIPVSSKSEIVNPVFGDFIAGASEVYARAGYTMTLSLVPDDGQADAYRAFARHGLVDGVVVQAPKRRDDRIGLLQQIGVPFVVHGRASEETSTYDWVDMDNRAAFCNATAHLTGLGHRRIAFLNGRETLDFASQRRAGWEAALHDADIAPDAALLRTGDMTEPFGFAAAARMLDGPNPPTAFLTASMLIAIGVRRAAEARGLSLGREISLVTHDDDLSYLRSAGPRGRDPAPVFTATQSSVRLAGRVAARMLLRRIRSPDAPPTQRLLRTRFCPGPTSGPAPEPKPR